MQNKILIYGEFWQGTLPSLLESNLRQRGYNVKTFDFTKIVPGISDRAIFNRLKRRVFHWWYERRVNLAFCEYVDAEKPDCIIVSKGLNLWPQTVSSVGQKCSKLVNWNPDDFFNSTNTNANLLGGFKYYDFIISSRKHLFGEYSNHGAKRMVYVDWYFVPDLHYPHSILNSYNITFVGSWSSAREQFISKLNSSVDIWGGGWARSSRGFRSNHRVNARIISQDEMSLIFSSSKFNLNLITHENRDLSNLRFFEVCASGGLLVTERNSSSTYFLVDREDCLMYDSVDDLNYILEAASSLDLRSIANSGHLKITMGKNAIGDRVDELLKAIGYDG